MKGNADEVALPPDHAALPNGVKIVEAQLEIDRQGIEGVKCNAGPGIRDILNAAGEDSALCVKEQQRVFRDRRPRDRSAFAFHPDTTVQARVPGKPSLANYAQAAITFDLLRKQSILINRKKPRFGGAAAGIKPAQLRLEHSAACSSCGTHNQA